jgi:DNA-directed RNA polymerase specialized sigma24 family protein
VAVFLPAIAPTHPPTIPATPPPLEVQSGNVGCPYVVAFVVRGERPTHEQSPFAAAPHADLRVVKDCLADDWDVTVETTLASRRSPAIVRSAMDDYDAAATTTIFGLSGDLWLESPVRSLDSDAALLFEVQSFLWCKAIGSPVPLFLQYAWGVFWRRYRPLVRRAVRRSCRFALSRHDLDDLVQEVWGAVVRQLPRLSIDPARGNLASWLVGLTRRKVHRLTHLLVSCGVGCSVAIEGLEATPAAPGLGPEEACCMWEEWEQWKAALGKLQMRTSAKGFDVFCRRYVDGQTNDEVAAALGMTPKAAQCCYDRTMRKWQAMTRGLGILGCNGEFAPSRNSPLPRKPR